MKKVIISITTILLLGLTVGCGCSKKEEIKKEEEKVKVNTNENIVKNQELEVFTFTNTSLVYKNKTSIFTTKVTNTSNDTQYIKEFKIHVKDKDNKDIVVLPGYIGYNIEANSSKTITTSYGSDFTNAYSIEYEIIR